MDTARRDDALLIHGTGTETPRFFTQNTNQLEKKHAHPN
jgi:hypothetical protein